MALLWEVQKAVYSALTDNNDLMEIVTGVYDYVPERTRYPYVFIEFEIAENISNLARQKYEISGKIVAYSIDTSRKKALDIMELVKESMNQDEIIVLGYEVVLVKQVAEKTRINEERNLFEVEAEFKIIVEKTT